MNERDETTKGDAKSTLSRVMVGAKYVSTLVGLLSGLHSAVKLLQAFRPRDPLSRIGLPRRRGHHVLGSIALVGAGVAVGTGIGMILAPASGAKTLRKIRRRIDEITGEEDRTSTRAVYASPARAPKNGTAATHPSA